MTNSQQGNQDDLFARPHFQLRSLPVNFRWEATRRHPIYQIFWRSLVHELELPSEAEAQLEEAIKWQSLIRLSKIGVTGQPVNPSVEFAGPRF